MTLSSRNRPVITEFQNGSYIAVKELYDEHYSALVDFARQLIIDKAEAHHIVQDTFIKLFGMRDRFHQLPDIKAFLYITVRNICFAYLKAEKKSGPDADPAWYVQALRSETRFDEADNRLAALPKMHSQVTELKAPERNVFTSIFYHRLTVPAAAQQLGLTPVAVIQHRIQAIRTLRNTLAAADLYSIPLFIYFVAVDCSMVESLPHPGTNNLL